MLSEQFASESLSVGLLPMSFMIITIHFQLAGEWFIINDSSKRVIQMQFLIIILRYNGQSYGATGERYIYGACLFLGKLLSIFPNSFFSFAIKNWPILTLFLGWGAMCLGILTGALFCCNSMTTMRDENDQEPYHQGFGSAPHPGIQYQAPKSMGHEYI